MNETRFDLERIKSVLLEATRVGAEFSQRSLDTAAGVTRGTVGEILRGKNLNPTTQVLSKLAHAIGEDLSVFGLAETGPVPPTVEELEIALLKAMNEMKGRSRMTLERQARFLASAVEQILRLPPQQQAIQPGRGASGGKGDMSPPPASS